MRCNERSLLRRRSRVRAPSTAPSNVAPTRTHYLIDIPDLKSGGCIAVRVQVPPPGPTSSPLLGTSCMIRRVAARTRIEPVKMATPAGLEPANIAL